MKYRHSAAAHWRGALPLASSFWLNSGLVMLLGSLAVGALSAWTRLGGAGLRLGSAGLLMTWPLFLVLALWSTTGTWRAAVAHAAAGDAPPRSRARRWARACSGTARLALVVAWLGLLASLSLNFVPDLGQHLRQAFGIDSGGHLAATLSSDGRRLRLQGPLGPGDAARVRRLLDGAPAAYLVELASPGGPLGEARELAEVLRARRLQLRAVGDCDNACVLLFLAGTDRQMTATSRLGLQRLAAGSFNPLFVHLVNRNLATAHRGAGLPEILVVKMLSTPPSWLWRPGRDELADHGVVSVPAHPLDIALPPVDGAQAADYADALTCNPAWHALEQRMPGTIAAAAERMQTVRRGSADDAAAQIAGQRVVEALLPRLLAQASPALREQFIELLGEQLATLQGSGTASCRALLAGDAEVRRTLPDAPARREAAWLADAAAETTSGTAPRRASALEAEVVRRTLGERAPALLAGLWQPTTPSKLDCGGAAALIGAVLALPPPERRLAIKHVFARL